MVLSYVMARHVFLHCNIAILSQQQTQQHAHDVLKQMQQQDKEN
jgi:hypothetical protein